MSDFNAPRIIDISCDPRRAHYEYFRSLAYPYAGVSVNVDITRFMQWRRERKLPFFLSLLYFASRAANSVPELRRRIRGDELLEFSWCTSSYTVAKPDGTYAYCVLRADMPFDEFIETARKRHEACRLGGNIEEDDSAIASFFISSVPWMSYTSITHPVPCPADSNPRISWGKYFEQDGRILLPVSLLCHHALADGLHMSRFYDALNEALGAL